jgi:predicted HicB family RNase H-like nuclease
MGKYKNSAISSFVNKNGTPKEQLEKVQIVSMDIEPEERHNRRVHLLMKQSVYQKVKNAAEQSGVSVNRVIESLIEKHL